jgi:hypothetical protein
MFPPLFHSFTAKGRGLSIFPSVRRLRCASHHDVAVLIVLTLCGSKLARGLGILQFQPNVARASALRKSEMYWR